MHAPTTATRVAASPAATLAVTSAAYFMVVLDLTIVNVALPALQRDLGTSLQGLQWILDAYVLLFAACVLTGGAIGDGFGARGTFAAGLGVFALASGACGLAPSTGVLIAARFVQGVGAALTVPASLSLIRHAYSDPRARAHAVGAWAGAGGTALAAGPLFGGVLVEAFGWRSLFLVNVAVGAAALVAIAVRIAPVPAVRRRIDLGGQVTAVLAVGGLTFALIEGPVLGWGAPAVLAALAATVGGGFAFARCERRAPDPMLPPALLRHAPFVGAALAAALQTLAFYVLLFVLTLFFQDARGASPVETGLAFLPLTGLIALANVLGPRLAGRFGTVRTIVAGQLAMAGGLAASLTLSGDSSWLESALPLLPIGVGGGISISALTAIALDAAPPGLAGGAAGAYNASRQVGGAIGVALSGALLASHSAFLDGMRLSLLAAVAAMLVAALLTAALLRVSPRRAA